MSDGNLKGFFGDAFNPANYEPTSDVLAPGKYPVEIETAEISETKAGNGHYIKVTMRILDGPGKNRKIWDYINIDNPSEMCVTIGMSQLSALCKAVGFVALKDTILLHGKTCLAHVVAKNDQNSVRTYSSAAIQQPQQPVQQPQQPVQQPQQPVQQPQQPVQQQPGSAYQPSQTPAPVQQPQQPAMNAPWQRQE